MPASTRTASGSDQWGSSIHQLTQGQAVAIYGKTLRRPHDRRAGQAAIHMVSAWASESSLVLGQTRTEAKSNEITAIPQLLEMLELKGCIVTIDAMGCRKGISQTILDRGADYVLAVKGNQGQLYQDMGDLFQAGDGTGVNDLPHDYATTLNKGHGRIERRECWSINDPPELAEGPPGVPEHCGGLAWSSERGDGEVTTMGGRAGIGGDALLHLQPGIGGPEVAGGGKGSLGHREFAALGAGCVLPGG